MWDWVNSILDLIGHAVAREAVAHPQAKLVFFTRRRRLSNFLPDTDQGICLNCRLTYDFFNQEGLTKWRPAATVFDDFIAEPGADDRRLAQAQH
ncbi:hypothetical protein SAMN03159444_02160 [Pseudomonas sp. NFACC02]|nr:hypothetical protein SAMN03159444_02160 [Pseudomonas sp. NFACC02]